MPVVLIVLCVLMALGVLSSALVGAWITSVLQALLLLGVITGKEGVRKVLMVLSVLQAGVAATFITLETIRFLDTLPEDVLPTPSLVLFGMAMVVRFSWPYLLALASGLFTLFALSRKSVQFWMYQRSMGDVAGVKSVPGDTMERAATTAVGSAGRSYFVGAALLAAAALGCYVCGQVLDGEAANRRDELEHYHPQCGRHSSDPVEKERWERCVELIDGRTESRPQAKSHTLNLAAIGALGAGAIAILAGVFQRQRVRKRLQAS